MPTNDPPSQNITPVYQIPPPIQIHPRIHIHLIISQILKDLYSHLLNLQNLPHQILLALPLHHHGIHVHPAPRRIPRRNEGKRRRNRKTQEKQEKQPFHPKTTEYEIPDTTPWSPQEFKQALQDLLTYDWDMTGLHILSLYKNDEVLLFHTLHRHKFKMELANIARVQKDLLDHAKKQNLEILKHSDDPLERRRFFNR